MLIRNNKGAGVLVRGNAVAHYSITGEKYTHGTMVLSTLRIGLPRQAQD